jgi:hypothetical protein
MDGTRSRIVTLAVAVALLGTAAAPASLGAQAADGAGTPVAAAGVQPAAAQPAAAQQPMQPAGPGYAIVAGYGAGYIQYGALNPGRGAPELALEPGWIVHGFVEGPAFGDLIGARLLGAFSQGPFEFDGASRSINTWLVDLTLVLRPFGLDGQGTISPFAVGGGGVITHGFGRAGRPVVIPEAGAMYSGDDQASWQLTFGGGIDIVPAGFAIGGTPVGIRIEAVDHMALRSPFTDLEGGRLGPVHNIRLGVSLVGLGSF